PEPRDRVTEARAETENDNGEDCAGDDRMQPGGKFVFAEEGEGGRLKPIDQGRFIEAILVVEIRDDPVAPLAHFAGGLGEAGFVAVQEREVPGTEGIEEENGQKQREGHLAAGPAVEEEEGLSADLGLAARAVAVLKLRCINHDGNGVSACPTRM